MKKQIGIGIIGGSGYGSGELLRLFCEHPHVEVVSAVSSSMPGQKVSDAHPHLLGFCDYNFDEKLDENSLLSYEKCFIFLALPHGKAASALSQIKCVNDSKVKTIDLSGDFRLKDRAIHEKHYHGASFLEELRKNFVYGLTELFCEQIASARFISNPGCLATAAILSVAPLALKGKNIDGDIIFDAKTGSSGAGRTPQASMHHPKRTANCAAYKILEHRHEAEICQALGDSFDNQSRTFFVPHLLPTSRGIFITSYLKLNKDMSAADLLDCYRQYYQNAPFIRLVKGSPELQNVVGTNFCDISLVSRGRQVVAMAALDNLVKGMAGQAIQNMNIMSGLPEDLGLRKPALGI